MNEKWEVYKAKTGREFGVLVMGRICLCAQFSDDVGYWWFIRQGEPFPTDTLVDSRNINEKLNYPTFEDAAIAVERYYEKHLKRTV